MISNGQLINSKKIVLILCLMVLGVFCFNLIPVLAVDPPGVPAPPSVPDPAGAPLPAGTGETGINIPNPLPTDDPRVVVGYVIRAILGLVGSLTLIFFIYGGMMWMLSGGNEEKVKKGKDILTWATLGLAVIFISYIIVAFVFNIITGATVAP